MAPTPPRSPSAEPELPPGLLGRATAEPGLTYRFLRLVWRAVASMLGVRLELQGSEHLPRDARGGPAGGWIAAVVPHRTWVDPFIPWILLPARPRFAFFGDARTMARSPLRRFLLRRLGGVIPIPAGRDPRTVDLHLGAARRVLEAGAIFMLMPESGPASKVGELRHLGRGMAYIALRNNAPIVPLVLGGNHELYLGRRIVLRVLPLLQPGALAGWTSTSMAAPGSVAERESARRLNEAFTAAVAAALPDVHFDAEPPPGTRKRALWLTRLFR